MADLIADGWVQKIDIFGTPWHGKVQGVSLTLPNESTMTYPQPSDKATRLASHDSECTYYDAALAGTNHLIAIPGLPAVTRTTEEAAADTAAGRQWKTQALLSGGRLQLYGKNLKGWIYVDAAGGRWLVECDALWPYPHVVGAGALETTVRLTRFGVIDLGTESPVLEQYEHEVSLAAGWLTKEPQVEYAWIHPTIDAITRTGNKAAIGLHCGQGEVQGYLEVAISGAGNDAAVSLSVLRTIDDCLTAEREDDVTEIIPAGPVDPGHYTSALTFSYSRLMTLWYDDNDAIVETRVEIVGSQDIDFWRTEGGYVTESGLTGTVSIALICGGETVDSDEFSVAAEQSRDGFNIVGSGTITFGEEEFIRTWDVDFELAGTSNYGGGIAGGAEASNDVGFSWHPGCGATVGVTDIVNPWLAAHTWSRHCSGLFSGAFTTSGGVTTEGSFIGRPAVTPSGVFGEAASLDYRPSQERRRDRVLIELPQYPSDMYYGSYDWLTGAVTLWQETPVNYV
jgi:hypothetical protein